MTISRDRKTGRNAEGQFEASWGTLEIQKLRVHAADGADALAERLGRSVDSVRAQARRQRISLRRPGEVRGRLFSQPNGTTFLDDRTPQLQKLRADVLAGVIDMVKLEERVTAITRGDPLCPRCVVLPVEVDVDGLCVPCHLRELALAHELADRDLEAHRELDAARQRHHRRLKAAGVR